MLGVVFDYLHESTKSVNFRRLQKFAFPVLFFVFLTMCTLGICFTEPGIPFDSHAWCFGKINDRFRMVTDLTEHHKIIGMSIKEAVALLGPPSQDPFVELLLEPKSDDPHLTYDMGHRSTKYGCCLVLYHKTDRDKITDWQITGYKF